MIIADISEAKARLSSYLAAVQAGDEVIITDRGRRVARIIKEPRRSASVAERLTGLAAARLVTLPLGAPFRDNPPPASNRRTTAVGHRLQRSSVIACFDTSALVKRYLAEQGTGEIAALWAEAEYHAVSRLAYAETLSALHRKEREQPSDQSELHEARARFERDWRTLLIVEISSKLDPWIRRILAQHPLKGADVVHLASCLLLESRLVSPLVFECWDQRLLHAARAEAIETVPREHVAGADPVSDQPEP